MLINGSSLGTDATFTRAETLATFTCGAANANPSAGQAKFDLANLGIWHGHRLTTGEIAALAIGISPELVAPANLVDSWDFVGGRLVGKRGDLLTGTGTLTIVEQPLTVYPPQPYQISSIVVVGGVTMPIFFHHYRTIGGRSNR